MTYAISDLCKKYSVELPAYDYRAYVWAEDLATPKIRTAEIKNRPSERGYSKEVWILKFIDWFKKLRLFYTLDEI